MLNDEVFNRSTIAPSVSIPSPRTSIEPTAPGELSSTGRHLRPRVISWVVLVDCAALVAAYLVVSSVALATALVLGVLVLTLNAAGGHYRPLVAPSLLDELPSLACRALTAGAVTTVLGVYLQQTVGEGPTLAAASFLVLACIGRAAGYACLRRWRSVHSSGRPTIVVGCGPVGDQLAGSLLEHPEYGLRPIGFVDDEASHRATVGRLPLLGDIDSLCRLVRSHDCDVIVAVDPSRESSLVDVLRSCDRTAGEIFVVPRLHELHDAGAGASIWGFPLTRLKRASHRSLSWRLKRLFDVVAASIGLLLLSPLLAICAVGVYMEGGPGVIFRQERVGLDGRRFMILKFRSLAPVDTTESEQRWSIRADPRLGPVGRTLRTLSLDELPQLWNVIRGDMSLVGPRPERPYFVNEFTQRIPHYAARHRVPAGLTGWAQISGLRGDTDISERARFDNYYIQNWSMWTDVKIILRTAGKVISRSGT